MKLAVADVNLLGPGFGGCSDIRKKVEISLLLNPESSFLENSAQISLWMDLSDPSSLPVLWICLARLVEVSSFE